MRGRYGSTQATSSDRKKMMLKHNPHGQTEWVQTGLTHRGEEKQWKQAKHE